MAITTADGLLAGVLPARLVNKASLGTTTSGRCYSWWGAAGSPGAGAYDTTLNGVTLTSPVNGQIPLDDPGGGANNYLARVAGTVNTGVLYLCDRLWHNGGFTITSTSAQNITSPTWPARDVNGATNGEGVLLVVEASATVGAGTPTITVSYTNEAGTSGRSATNVDATVASPFAGHAFRIGLQAGDKGVRSVQSLTLSATWTSGTINLVAYRIIAAIALPGGDFNADALQLGLPRCYTGTVPFFLYHSTAAAAVRPNFAVNFATG